MTIKVGVVGAGVMGRLHAEVYKGEVGVELCAIAEPDISAHEKLRTQFDVPVHENFHDFIDQVDAISVCTPDHVRKDVLLPALERGVRVLVEKPLATSLEEAAQLVDASHRADGLMVGHLLRFDPRVVQAREATRRGDLGELWSLRCWRSNSRLVADRISSRASVDWFLGIHDIDMIRFVTDREVEAVRATARSFLSTNRDLVHGELVLNGGLSVQFWWSWNLPAQRSSGLQAGLELVGDSGMLEVELSHNSVALTTEPSGRQANLDTYHWPPQQNAPGGDLREQIRAFLYSPQGENTAATPTDGLRAVGVISAIEESIHSGAVVEIPTT